MLLVTCQRSKIWIEFEPRKSTYSVNRPFMGASFWPVWSESKWSSIETQFGRQQIYKWWYGARLDRMTTITWLFSYLHMRFEKVEFPSSEQFKIRLNMQFCSTQVALARCHWNTCTVPHDPRNWDQDDESICVSGLYDLLLFSIVQTAGVNVLEYRKRQPSPRPTFPYSYQLPYRTFIGPLSHSRPIFHSHQLNPTTSKTIPRSLYPTLLTPSILIRYHLAAKISHPPPAPRLSPGWFFFCRHVQSQGWKTPKLWVDGLDGPDDQTGTTQVCPAGPLSGK
jgi:hypothetical protein